MSTVLVVGAGPAGSAAGIVLADAGYDVTIVDRSRFPRDKACGDGLTPAALAELERIGAEETTSDGHPVDGLRLVHRGRSQEMRWPHRPGVPRRGVVVPRFRLDAGLVAEARRRGVEVVEGVAARPVWRDGRLAVDVGGELRTPRYVVIADGASSPFGRAAGTVRDRRFPLGVAVRAYHVSSRSGDRFLECRLGLTDDDGRPVPGYGWVFPVGDGTANVGVIALTTAGRWRGVKTMPLYRRFVLSVADDWGLRPEPRERPRGGILPAALGITPEAGPNWLAVGDAGGTVNPFTGEGIAAALGSGRLAAETIDAALRHGDPSLLRRYPSLLEERFGDHYRVGRIFVSALRRPWLHRAAPAVVGSGPVARWLFELTLGPPVNGRVGRGIYRLLVAAAGRRFRVSRSGTRPTAPW